VLKKVPRLADVRSSGGLDPYVLNLCNKISQYLPDKKLGWPQTGPNLSAERNILSCTERPIPAFLSDGEGISYFNKNAYIKRPKAMCTDI
jgi:hypothetical protein